MRSAFGGVVINEQSKVLLRQPMDQSKGHSWTFPKGKPLEGESPDQTALREVLEETGIRARILQKLEGTYNGRNTSNEYFLMSPVEDTGRFDEETHSITWVTKTEARELILLTQKRNRRRRDLRVLKNAYQALAELSAVGREVLQEPAARKEPELPPEQP